MKGGVLLKYQKTKSICESAIRHQSNSLTVVLESKAGQQLTNII